MSETKDSTTKMIYIHLLNEGTTVLRPVEAIEVSPNVYRILESNNYDPDIEEWEFLPGNVVECKMERHSEGRILVAKEKVDGRGFPGWGASGDV